MTERHEERVRGAPWVKFPREESRRWVCGGDSAVGFDVEAVEAEIGVAQIVAGWNGGQDEKSARD